MPVFILSILLLFLPLKNTFTQDIITNKKELIPDKIYFITDWQQKKITTKIHISWDDNKNNIYDIQNIMYQSAYNTLPTTLSLIINTLPTSGKYTLFQFITQQDKQISSFIEMQKNTTLLQHIPDDNLFGSTLEYVTDIATVIKGVVYSELSFIPFPPRTSIYKIIDNSPYTALIFMVNKKIPYNINTNKKSFFIPKIIPKVFAPQGFTVYTPEYFKNIKDKTTYPFTYVYEKNIEFYYKDIGILPLIIYPMAITDEKASDVIVSKNDSCLILDNPRVKNLITEGKVFFIINKPYAQIVHQSEKINTKTP